MKNIKLAYDYLFFTFYRLWEKVPSKWWSEWKAGITMIFLWIALISAISNMQMYFFKTVSLSDYPFFALSLCFVIGIIHHFMYTHNNKWKDKISKFRDMDKKKDTYGILFIILLSGLIIFALIYSNYLLGTVNWQKFK
jgi:L-cystine uptake protein TcyP (sodium:dicarboxylate symporter family)